MTLAAALALAIPTVGQPVGEPGAAQTATPKPVKPHRPFTLPPAVVAAIGAQRQAQPNVQVVVARTNPAPAKPGDPVDLTVTISNVGDAPAYRIRVTSTSTGLKIGAPGPLCDSVYLCPNGGLAAGQSVTLTTQGVVGAWGGYSYVVHAVGVTGGDNPGTLNGEVDPPSKPPPPPPTAATNGPGAPQPEPPTAATPATPIAATPGVENPPPPDAIDVSVSKIPIPAGNFRPGDEIDFTLMVANAGPATAHGVRVLLKATNLSLASAGACSGMRCEIGDLAPGATVTITEGATITRPGPFLLFAQVPVAKNDVQRDNNRTAAADDGVAYAFEPPPPSPPWPWIVGGGVAAVLAAGAGARALQRRWWRGHITVTPRFTPGGPTSAGPLTMTAPPLSVRVWIEKGPAGPAAPVPILKETPDV